MEPTVNYKAEREVEREFTLPSGKKAKLYKGKGKDARIAMRMAGGDGSTYLNALMSRLLVIDDKEMTMEQFDELDLKDYNECMAAVTDAGANFKSPESNSPSSPTS